MKGGVSSAAVDGTLVMSSHPVQIPSGLSAYDFGAGLAYVDPTLPALEIGVDDMIADVK